MFKNHFRKKYLIETCDDDKAKEFRDLKMEQHTMDEFLNMFISLQRYVSYLWEEKDKIQHFISFLPEAYQDMMEFVRLKTMKETIKKLKLCYSQFK